jgi:hypothetical protein
LLCCRRVLAFCSCCMSCKPQHTAQLLSPTVRNYHATALPCSTACVLYHGLNSATTPGMHAPACWNPHQTWKHECTHSHFAVALLQVLSRHVPLKAAAAAAARSRSCARCLQEPPRQHGQALLQALPLHRWQLRCPPAAHRCRLQLDQPASLHICPAGTASRQGQNSKQR